MDDGAFGRRRLTVTLFLLLAVTLLIRLRDFADWFGEFVNRYCHSVSNPRQIGRILTNQQISDQFRYTKA